MSNLSVTSGGVTTAYDFESDEAMSAIEDFENGEGIFGLSPVEEDIPLHKGDPLQHDAMGADEFDVDIPIAKTDDDRHLVFGWAQVAFEKDGSIVVDRQGDYIAKVDELENAAYDYVINSRDMGEMHIRKGVGQVVESMVFTVEKMEALGIPEGTLPVGWWVGYKINDDDVWDGVKSGRYSMFSVHGKGKRTHAE